MSIQHFVLRPDQHERALNVVGTQVTVLAYACTVGTLVHVPRGTVHGFSYGSGGGQMLEITGSGAQAAQLFTAIEDEIPVGPPDVPKLLDVAKRNGVTVAT